MKNYTTLNIYFDKCPCGSNKIIKKCNCYNLVTKTLHRKSLKIRKPNSSAYQNPNCLAAPLGGCSHKISKEHFFTKAILKNFSPVKNGVKISGFPWQQGSITNIPLSSFQSKILCVSHNNALSELDEMGMKFFSAYMESGNVDNKEKNYKKIYLFNGYDIEKWMLKCSLGYLFSKNLTFKGEQVTNPYPVREWLLKILFSDSHLPGT